MDSKSRSACSTALAALLLAAGSASADPFPPWTPLATLYGDRLRVDPAVAAKSSSASAPSATYEAGGLARDDVQPAPHSGKKALLYSLLLPGLGEHSMGHRGRATGFFVAEGLIWASFVYWTVAGNLRQDDYIEQAQLNAGIGVDEGSDDYWRTVGQFDRSSGSGPGSYEEELRREARDTYPFDPAAQDAFVAERLPAGDRAWEWSSSDLQASYRETRESSNRAFNRAKYSFAAAILNRVLSVIDVQLLRRKASSEAQSSREEEAEYRLYAGTAADGSGKLVIQRRF